MFCKNCGAEIKEGKFCPNCGVEVCEIENKLNLEGQTPKKIKIEYGEAKAGKTDRSGKFAKTGFILGLISLITTVAGYFVVPLPILGLVFSTKGLKSVEYYSRAKTGKGLSTAALIIGAIEYVISLIFALFSFIFIVAYYIFFIILMLSQY